MKAVALMYHDVVEESEGCDFSGFPGPDAARYKLDRQEFACHLEAIARALRGKPARVRQRPVGAEAEKLFVITFDDGGVSCYRHIADLLEQCGWYGHFFVSTDYIGTKAFLSASQICELRQRGHVIGSHSSSHPLRISHCTWGELLREWSTSIDVLSQILGEKVKVASVPGGYYSKRVARAASQTGIEVLFTSEPTSGVHQVGDCLVLGRYTIRRGTSAHLAARLAEDRFGPRLTQQFSWSTKKVAKALGGRYYFQFKESILRRN
jgi:Polysaccharide deacetylase